MHHLDLAEFFPILYEIIVNLVSDCIVFVSSYYPFAITGTVLQTGSTGLGLKSFFATSFVFHLFICFCFLVASSISFDSFTAFFSRNHLPSSYLEHNYLKLPPFWCTTTSLFLALHLTSACFLVNIGFSMHLYSLTCLQKFLSEVGRHCHFLRNRNHLVSFQRFESIWTVSVPNIVCGTTFKERIFCLYRYFVSV